MVFLVLTSTIAWVVANPPRIDQFSSVSVLGPDMTAASYFPGNSTTVAPNAQINWTVRVYNHMGSVQLFLLQVLLSNLTIYGPNPTNNVPSERSLAAPLFNATRAVQDNETWILPLQWSIVDDPSVGGTTTIQTMWINNLPLAVNPLVSASGGMNFRIVIELWSYDTQLRDFIFSFTSNGSVASVFDQIWFDTG